MGGRSQSYGIWINFAADNIGNPMSFAAICQLLEPELNAVNDTIRRCLESHVEIINKISHYLIESWRQTYSPPGRVIER